MESEKKITKKESFEIKEVGKPEVSERLARKEEEVFERAYSSACEVLEKKRREFALSAENFREIKGAFETKLAEVIGETAKKYLKENEDLKKRFNIENVDELTPEQAFNYLQGNEDFKKYLYKNPEYQRYAYLNETIERLGKDNLSPDAKLILYKIAQEKGVSEDALINLWENINLKKIEKKEVGEIKSELLEEKKDEIKNKIQQNKEVIDQLKEVGILSEDEVERIKEGRIEGESEILRYRGLIEAVGTQRIEKVGKIRKRIIFGDKKYKPEEFKKILEEKISDYERKFDSELSDKINQEKTNVENSLKNFGEKIEKEEVLDELYTHWQTLIAKEGLKRLPRGAEVLEEYAEEKGVDIAEGLKKTTKVVEEIFDEVEKARKEGALKEWCDKFEGVEIGRLLKEEFRIFEELSYEKILEKLKESPYEFFDYAKKGKMGILEYILRLIIWSIEQGLGKK